MDNKLLKETENHNPPLIKHDIEDHYLETIRLYRALYEANEVNIDGATGKGAKRLKKYKDHFVHEFRKYQVNPENLISIDNFRDLLKEKNTIVLGSYHSLAESLYLTMDLLNELSKNDVPVILFSELIAVEDQSFLDTCLAGKGDMDELISTIRKRYPYREKALVREFLDFLRDHGIRTIAADFPDLKFDGYAKAYTDLLAATIDKNRNATVLATIGQFHIASLNAFNSIKKSIGDTRSLLRIVQNFPDYFWQLYPDEMSNNFNIINLDEQTIAFSYIPPIYVQNSYLAWQRNEVRFIDSFRVYESFLDILQRLKADFSIDFIMSEEKLKVYHFRDLNFLGEIYKLRFNTKELEFIKDQIKRGESFYIKKRTNNIIFLSNLSLAHVAEEATHYLKQNFIKGRTKRSVSDQFYFQILHEMIGFFGSKLICSERLAPSFDDYFDIAEGDSEESVSEDDRKISEFILNYFKTGTITQVEDDSVLRLPINIYKGIVHGIGYLTGEYLYRSYKADLVDKKFIKDLIINEFKKEKCFKLFCEILSSIVQIEQV